MWSKFKDWGTPKCIQSINSFKGIQKFEQVNTHVLLNLLCVPCHVGYVCPLVQLYEEAWVYEYEYIFMKSCIYIFMKSMCAT